jgi:hypothetical protein
MIEHHVRHFRGLYPEITSMFSNPMTLSESAAEVHSAILTGQRQERLVLSMPRQGILSETPVIQQLAGYFKQFGAEAFRHPSKPWIISYSDAHVIDAGGPAREVLNVGISSIFGRFVIGTNGDKSVYLPWSQNTDVLWAIGVLLGIVVRTGQFQELPFADIVWKFLAGEEIRPKDVFLADPSWDRSTFLNWDSSEAPEQEEGPVQWRIAELAKMLRPVKEGLDQNLGIRGHAQMSGRVLRRLAEGEHVILASQMKIATFVPESEFPGGERNEFVARLWRVVEAFDNAHRGLYLKFITGTARIPRQEEFRITIKKEVVADPDGALPRASTCYQYLYWPKYTSDEVARQTLTFAIESADGMDDAH